VNASRPKRRCPRGCHVVEDRRTSSCRWGRDALRRGRIGRRRRGWRASKILVRCVGLAACISAPSSSFELRTNEQSSARSHENLPASRKFALAAPLRVTSFMTSRRSVALDDLFHHPHHRLCWWTIEFYNYLVKFWIRRCSQHSPLPFERPARGALGLPEMRLVVGDRSMALEGTTVIYDVNGFGPPVRLRGGGRPACLSSMACKLWAWLSPCRRNLLPYTADPAASRRSPLPPPAFPINLSQQQHPLFHTWYDTD